MKVYMNSKGLATAAMIAMMVAIAPAYSDETTVPVEEIEINPPSNTEKAAGLWDQTKEKTSAAANSAAEYSKVQGSRALEASKKGLEKGTDAVVTGSKKAWETTKEVSGKVADYTTDKAKQVSEAVTNTMSPPAEDPPVSDHSTPSQTN